MLGSLEDVTGPESRVEKAAEFYSDITAEEIESSALVTGVDRCWRYTFQLQVIWLPYNNPQLVWIWMAGIIALARALFACCAFGFLPITPNVA
jgi:hypothetical protein